MSLYLDASVVLPILIEEPHSAVLRAYLAALAQESVCISDFAVTEVASGISRLVRMDRLGAADAQRRLEDLEIWRTAATSPIELHSADARLAYIFARRFELKLRAPDALHLAVARRLDLTLVTFDRRLVVAARVLGVPVAVPGADSDGDPR